MIFYLQFSCQVARSRTLRQIVYYGILSWTPDSSYNFHRKKEKPISPTSGAKVIYHIMIRLSNAFLVLIPIFKLNFNFQLRF